VDRDTKKKMVLYIERGIGKDAGFICIKINFACHLFVAVAPLEFYFSDFRRHSNSALFSVFFVATASRVLWPSRRSCAVLTTGPTHHYADWIITIAYIRRPYGSPAKDSVPARVSLYPNPSHNKRTKSAGNK